MIYTQSNCNYPVGVVETHRKKITIFSVHVLRTEKKIYTRTGKSNRGQGWVGAAGFGVGGLAPSASVSFM